MKPKFKLGQWVVCTDSILDIEIFKIDKRKYDLDEDTMEYYGYDHDVSFYEYHLKTVNQAIKDVNQYKKFCKENIKRWQDELNMMDKYLSQLENIKNPPPEK